MKAVVYHGSADIRLEDVPEPKLTEATDAIVRLTSSAVCGTDLHMVRGTMPGMREGTILGHEGVGIVEEVGPYVRNLRPGDRVIIPSTIACGSCSYCRAGYQAQCDNANPRGSRAGSAFFGGPEDTGPFDGLQAEFARVPCANAGLVPVPDSVSDDQAIMLSDIYPTGWFGAKLAEVTPGDTVAVFGAGPVGQFAVLSAFQQGAGRVIAVDGIASRLAGARALHAETVDFNEEDPVEIILEMTRGIGVDRAIDAVGVDAQHPSSGPAVPGDEAAEEFAAERDAATAGGARPAGDTWVPGDAPSQVTRWSAEAVAKAGSIGIVGLYPPTLNAYPIGTALNRNLTIKLGICHHRRYIPELLAMVEAGTVDPATIITQHEPVSSALDAYQAFDRRETGWTKVVLDPAA
ncbi:S-(hydroxymethyl)glutathione dehydrogenase [Frankia canadensis]|uniref:S-(Hydroxymethyl)glutathione dehydrogenase n=1 Tax=Frankia canadensis TaxID=1836972 RepID=A0A2I2KLI7_9ACTN|nr:zinc-dependent alcohol dehydrogenase [Frankia canadensis]SNQ46532.1 S-(hydroxymethyl)glutathione dehydrogenase [Frankia canadensis]SOU53822.1 S-(hydroxymethyl)glutathione dehydrogenase [Frankia canadensis]